MKERTPRQRGGEPRGRLRDVPSHESGDVTPDPARPGFQKAAQALKAWKRMRDRLAAGEISEEDYEAWKARFRG